MTKKQSKRDIVRNYIIDNELYTIPNKQIAKMLLRNFPETFGEYNDKNIELARGNVRIIRGSSGTNSSTKAADKIIQEKFHNFISPDINDYEDFIIPQEVTRLAILNDIHFPYQHQRNLDAAIKFIKKRKVNGILLNGDIIDCYKVSYFLKDPRYRNIPEEFEILRNFIDELNAEFDCPIFYKIGNHEERIEMTVMRQIPELVDYLTFEDCLSDRGNFDLDEYKVTVIKEKRKIKFTDNLTILHGHEYRTGMWNPVGIARWLFNKAKANAACGHGHKSDSFAARSLNSETITTYAVGCLCDMTPQYMPLNDWQSGFAVVVRDGDNYKFSNYMIEKGRVL